MKYLITGGAGFIGSYIVDLLIEKGQDVVIIDNLSTGNIKNVNEKSKFYKADITEDLSKIFKKEKPEIVIHLAAQAMLRESIKDPISDAKTNIIGTINILEECRKNDIKRIVYTSTGGARVGEPEYFPVDEKHPLNPSSPYGISKHTAEHYVWMYNKLYGLDYLIFCFGNVYGPRDNPGCNRIIPLFIMKMLRGETPKIFGDGKQTRDFIYVHDLANFIVNSLEKEPSSKLFHLSNGEQISMNKIFKTLKELTGFKKNAEHIEEVRGEIKNIVLDIALVKEELDWEPKYNFDRGIRETVRWFKDNYP